MIVVLATVASVATVSGRERLLRTQSVVSTLPPMPLSPVTPFILTSTAFKNGGAIPTRFTCDGANQSPALRWSGAPVGTKALALIVVDPDAHGFVQWLAWNIAPSSGMLPASLSRLAAAPRQGINDFGNRGYDGPCPPSGRHRYRFAIYSLDRALNLSGSARVATLMAVMQGHVTGTTVLSGTYRRH